MKKPFFACILSLLILLFIQASDSGTNQFGSIQTDSQGSAGILSGTDHKNPGRYPGGMLLSPLMEGYENIGNDFSYGGDIKVNPGDTVILRLQGYSGPIQWQESSDSQSWTDIPGSVSDTLICKVSKSAYYRAMVITGDNLTIFSDVHKIQVYTQIPEYRSAQMGLYLLQQKLVDQLVILGELRADLLEVTENAGQDMADVRNFTVTPGNRYASPVNFYRLIAACNSLLRKLETNHPEVLDKEAPVNNYVRLYGEVLCMRAWAYFNASRIYGKIPLFPETPMTTAEINNYANSPITLEFDKKITFSPDGYNNDTIYNYHLELENKFLDIPTVIDVFTHELETGIRETGEITDSTIIDPKWNATIWTNYSRLALLGQMYLSRGDLVRARASFRPIMFNNDPGYGIRFGLDQTFKGYKWRNILTTINQNEHIFVLRFNKAGKQVHELQYLFSNLPPNSYQLKPSRQAVHYWETIWAGFRRTTSDQTGQVILDPLFPGNPGDFYRGINVSYGYFRDGIPLSSSLVDSMLNYKRLESYVDVNNIMDGVDTVITKYSLNKNPFDQDANFILYRAAGVHLYYAEVLTNQFTLSPGSSFPTVDLQQAQDILNNGNYRLLSGNRGVRGRVGFPGINSRVNNVYLHDPYTNEVIGVRYLGSIAASQEYLEDMIIEEKARELAYEGERFYDLMRIAKRRNDPSFLADKVASKFTGTQKENIRTLLMNEENWYIPFQIDWSDISDYQQYAEWIDEKNGMKKEVDVNIWKVPGIIAWYPFSGNVTDMSGNGNHGTLSGAQPAVSRFGTTDRAFRFDGVDDSVTVMLEVPGQLSFSVWTKPERTDNEQIVMQFNDISGSRISCLLNKSTIGVSWSNPAGLIESYYTEQQVQTGEWVHIAGMFSGNELTLYLNGEYYGRKILRDEINMTYVYAIIGCGKGNENPFTGTIDDIRILGREMSRPEIRNYCREVMHPGFVVDKTVKKDSLTVRFTDISSSTNPITSWKWDFNNDGIIDSEEKNPSWTFDSIGIYSVSLTISDGFNTRTIIKKDLIETFDPDRGLIAWYPLNGDGADATGNGNTGHPIGVLPAVDRVGFPGNALHFDGNNDYLRVDNVNYPSGNNPLISIAVWVKKENCNHFGAVFGMSGEEGTGNAIALGFGDSLDYTKGGDRLFVLHSGTDNIWNTGVDITDTLWHHLVYVFDGNYNNLYLNGVLAGRSISSFSLSDSSQVNIGYWDDFKGSDYYLCGKLDNMRVFNRTLSHNEVEYCYHQEMPRPRYDSLRIEGEHLVKNNHPIYFYWKEFVKVTTELDRTPGLRLSQYASGDSLIQMDFGTSYTGKYEIEFPVGKVPPGFYRMVIRSGSRPSGRFAFYINGEKKHEIDLFSIRQIVKSVTGELFIPSGGLNSFDFWVGHIKDYENVIIKMEYLSRGAASVNGFVLDYLELIVSEDTISLPGVETTPVIKTDINSIICGGSVISDGGDIISERGICWSTDPYPGIYDNKTTHGPGNNEFQDTISITMTGTYYFRAYATNSRGTAYGQEYTAFFDVDVGGMVVAKTPAFRIYPNPCSGEFYIENVLPGEEMRIEVISLSGSVLLYDCISPGNSGYVNTNISHLADGLYFLRVRQGNLINMSKILLKR